MTDVNIEGRSGEKAILLLAAAEALGLGPDVVRTTSGGYTVPQDVADEAGLGDTEDAPATKKATAKKAPAKKAAAKKAAAKPASEE